MIGSHVLEGNIMKLSKPFLVTEDVKSSDHDEVTTEFRVIGIVHKKILFNIRPKIKTVL